MTCLAKRRLRRRAHRERAQDRYGALQDLIYPVVGQLLLKQLAGADLFRLTQTMPWCPPCSGPNIRELYLRIADALQERSDAYGANGFNITLKQWRCARSNSATPGSVTTYRQCDIKSSFARSMSREICLATEAA